MKKFIRVGKTLALAFCILMLGLTACGSKAEEESAADASVSSVSVNKDGSITSKIVEDFAESYYDVDGLKSMIETAIAEYKSQNDAAQISLKKCEKTEGAIEVLIEFGSFSDYAGFNEEDFFAGTIQAANQAGYDLNVTLQATSDSLEKASISKPELLGMGDHHIIIIEAAKTEEVGDLETIRVNCFGEILYVGEGVTAVDKKSADVTLSDGYGIIVFK